jgi:excisionase family DNA binding protein
VSVTLPVPNEWLDAITERVVERLQTPRRWASVETAAAHFDVPVSRIYDWRQRGMPAIREGRRLLMDLSAVEEWLERQ